MNFKYMIIEQILQKYKFPHKFLVRYAVAAARHANSKVKRPAVDAEACLKAVEMWLEGQATIADCHSAADILASQSIQCGNIGYVASCALNSVQAAVYSTYGLGNHGALYAVRHAADSAPGYRHAQSYYKKMLIAMIDDLSEIEKILIGIL